MRILEILTYGQDPEYLFTGVLRQAPKGLAAPLLDGPSPDYPEVVFMSRHP